MLSLEEIAREEGLDAADVRWISFAYLGNESAAARRIDYNRKNGHPLFYGAPWVTAERRLISSLLESKSIESIASELRRPVSSLTSKLMKLGLLNEKTSQTFLFTDGKSLKLSDEQVRALNKDFDANEAKFRADALKKKSVDAPKKVASANVVDNVEITEEFKRVLDFVESKQDSKNGSAIFVTGVAGVGKSVLIGLLESKFKNVCLSAPTGKAALNIGGATIHSVFSLGRIATVAALSQPRMALKPEKKAVLASFKNIVLDEVSMCDAEVMQCINLRLQQAKGNDLPFGGCNLILVGDLLQLPPVVTAERAEVLYNYDSPYFFSAPIIKSINMPVVQLTKTFRQKDPVLSSILNNVRVGENVYESLAWFNNKAYLDKRDQPFGSDTTFLVLSNKEAFDINARELGKLPGNSSQYEAVRTGTFLDKQDTPSSGSAPFMLELKKGARVIVIKNGQDCVNGDMGHVTKLEQDKVEIELDDGRKATLERDVWEEVEYVQNKNGEAEKVIKGDCKQFPLLLGYAITTHRAQGMSLSCATVKFPAWQRGKHYGPFNEGQVYVALSRVRSLEGLRLVNPIHPDAIKVSQVALAFYQQHGITHQVSEVPDYKRSRISSTTTSANNRNEQSNGSEGEKITQEQSKEVATNVTPSEESGKNQTTKPIVFGCQSQNESPSPAASPNESHSPPSLTQPQPIGGKAPLTRLLTSEESVQVAQSYPAYIEAVKVKLKLGPLTLRPLAAAKPVEDESQGQGPGQSGHKEEPNVSRQKALAEDAVVGSEERQSAKRLQMLDEQMLSAFNSVVSQKGGDDENNDQQCDSVCDQAPKC